ncbi:MAG TPA: hypothetical protein VHL80_01685, partial [Polyangia bacterium]|nr:hypothetical protein [Polyangia bacterium]
TAGAGASDAAAAPAMAPPPVDPGDVPYVGPGALRPGPIAIVPESGRAYVGLANAAFVLAFDVAPGALAPSGTASAIPLHEGALGVNRVRLSIDPYKDKTTGNLPSGTFIGNDPALDDERRPIVADREYLYVVARDGSLRIVQVAHLPETECETNRDFTLAVNAPLRDVACPPVIGQSVRLPGAIGPGIRLPSPPVDVAVADIRPDPADPSETSVTGAHAWVLSASGAVFLVNIDPVLRHIFFVSDADPSMNPVHACLTPTGDCETETSPPPNTLRNRNFLGFTPALDSSSGPARLDIPPAQSTIGPRIESIWTRGTAANATALTGDFIRTEAFFPDQADVTPQTWTVTWQGNLMASPRLTGQLRSDGSLVDLGLDFCRTGVLRSDIVTFVGCTDTNQCGIGETCVQGSNGAEGAGGLPITGLCLPSTLNHAACDDLLSTVKRYEVTSATTGVLGLIPHKDELVRPALKPCVNLPAGGADGGAGDAGAAPRDASSPDAGADARGAMMNDCVDPEDPSTSTFQCLEGRCLVPCPTPGQTTGCRDGRICVDFSPSCIDGDCFFCADGPPLNKSGSLLPSCLGELIPYQVGVGRGFAVAGSQTGLPATGAAGPDGQCTRMPDLDPRVNARITMDDPMCAAASFPPMPSAITDLSVAQLDSRCDPNLSDPGCPVAAGDPTKAATIASSLLNILEANNLPNPCQYIGGPNETDTPNTLHTHVKALFRNRELHFGMTNLERPPSGIFQIRFDVHGGFQAQQVTIPPTVEVNMPARIVLGPFDAANPVGKTVPAPTAEVPYLFVVDQRRLGNAQGGGPTRGQLLRINPLGLAVTVPVAGNAPWYEDLSHSANEFPIQ